MIGTGAGRSITTALVADGSVAVVWRGDVSSVDDPLRSNERLRPVVEAIGALDAVVVPVVYRDEIADAVQVRLSGFDVVLVWVDPIGGGEDRVRFDALLRAVSADGVFVSAHPDVIASIGTKAVLFNTRELGWGADIHRYDDVQALRRELPVRLRSGPRVLKQERGNGGIGVWRVERFDDVRVLVQEAHVRDLGGEVVAFAEFVDRCEPYFESGGCVIDQAFQRRVAEGLIRVYLVGDEVVGFARQSADSLIADPEDAARVMGLPSPKMMFPAEHEPLQSLRRSLECEWLPAMQNLLGVSTDRLPLLWDADFLLGARAADGVDSYVLCEINASCVTPFPPEAVDRLAAAAVDRARAGRR
jgi:hypothetical protein